MCDAAQREQTKQLATAAAFAIKGDCEHCGGTGYSDQTVRQIVHCFSPSGFGSDWELARVHAAIDSARYVRWTNDITGHDLVVSIDGEPYRFQVKKPARAEDAA
ncbi:hypothetical protein [Lentzea cavernae]|uniref:hypothetical protein n=1 Tax=Lentzea cavernae TaxID=2020703 RepID=UPI00174C4D99|nr:hypothetical protein [Lentzea cavernae]